jgi:hypothetical protein
MSFLSPSRFRGRDETCVVGLSFLVIVVDRKLPVEALGDVQLTVFVDQLLVDSGRTFDPGKS